MPAQRDRYRRAALESDAMTPRPRGRVRLLARLLWVGAVLFILGLFVAALPIRYAQLLTLATLPPEVAPATVQASLAGVGLSLAAYATYVIAIQVVVVVGFVAVAGVIFWRTGADWLAVFISLMLVAIGVNPDTTALSQINPLWGAVGEFVGDAAWAALVIFFYIFPDGRFRPGWTRLVALGVVALQAGSTLFPAAAVNLDTWPPVARSLLLMLLFGIGLFAQIYRYRRLSNPVQRQQTKWAVFGSTAAILLLIGLGIPATLLPSLAAGSPYGLLIEPGIPLVLLLIPVSLALAAFSAHLRAEVGLSTLTDDLIAVVDETMQPAAISLWLKPPPAP